MADESTAIKDIYLHNAYTKEDIPPQNSPMMGRYNTESVPFESEKSKYFTGILVYMLIANKKFLNIYILIKLNIMI